MSKDTVYHQLGQFVVQFQHIEEALNNLFILLAQTNDEVVLILVNELEYSKRVKTIDVLFAYFVELNPNAQKESITEFHKLMVELDKLGTRRNELVHSKYNTWFNLDGGEGLLRNNSLLRGKKGRREQTEEELQPENFSQDFQRLQLAASNLECFRQRVINWLFVD